MFAGRVVVLVALMGCGPLVTVPDRFAGKSLVRITVDRALPTGLCAIEMKFASDLSSFKGSPLTSPRNWLSARVAPNEYVEVQVKAKELRVQLGGCDNAWMAFATIDTRKVHELVVVEKGRTPPAPSPGFDRIEVAKAEILESYRNREAEREAEESPAAESSTESCLPDGADPDDGPGGWAKCCSQRLRRVERCDRADCGWRCCSGGANCN